MSVPRKVVKVFQLVSWKEHYSSQGHSIANSLVPLVYAKGTEVDSVCDQGLQICT